MERGGVRSQTVRVRVSGLDPLVGVDLGLGNLGLGNLGLGLAASIHLSVGTLPLIAWTLASKSIPGRIRLRARVS